jgi:hypothetical protein
VSQVSAQTTSPFDESKFAARFVPSAIDALPTLIYELPLAVFSLLFEYAAFALDA